VNLAVRHKNTMRVLIHAFTAADPTQASAMRSP
jgi:hypothetical protein